VQRGGEGERRWNAWQYAPSTNVDFCPGAMRNYGPRKRQGRYKQSWDVL
jgi:hypothetical protein